MTTSKMLWSKSTRIKVMITIDTAFFLLEIIAGFLSHSLALMADAFHMVGDPNKGIRVDLLLTCQQLNDIISLVIGLWAVVAAQKATTDEFTFGVSTRQLLCHMWALH
jgi:solute carrier family 30 (zinc transporter), member 1